MQEDTEKPTEESINPETSDEQPMDAEAESSAPKKDYDSVCACAIVIRIIKVILTCFSHRILAQVAVTWKVNLPLQV